MLTEEERHAAIGTFLDTWFVSAPGFVETWQTLFRQSLETLLDAMNDSTGGMTQRIASHPSGLDIVQRYGDALAAEAFDAVREHFAIAILTAQMDDNPDDPAT